MLLHQLFRFGIIGTMAALLNMLVVVLLVHFAHWWPLAANILAFIVAYQVSFFGHHYWTFQSGISAKTAWPKFLLVALGSFLLNEGCYALFLQVLHVQYIWALLLVLLIVPPITFAFSRLWAFR
jgi:putative flippase GtrA